MGVEPASAAPSPKQPRRFQFYIADLLLLLLVVGLAGVFLLVPVMDGYCRRPTGWQRWGYDTERSLVWSALVLGPAVLAGILALAYVARRRLIGWRRGAVLVLLQTIIYGLVLTVWSVLAVMSHHHGPIGRNESSTIGSCRSFIEAQGIYRRTDWDEDGILEYAPRLRGESGLYEPRRGAGDAQLADEDMAKAEFEGAATRCHKNGYVFKVLTAQGAGAQKGWMDYYETGPDGKPHLTRGVAVAACPIVYDLTGRQLFIANHDGWIYGRDFGEQTPEVFEKLTEFDPEFMGKWAPTE